MRLMLMVLLSCLPALSDKENSNVIGSHEPVKVVVGDNAILPCHLDPPFNATTLGVHWKRNKANVHTYRSGGDDFAQQDKNFKNRTSLARDELRTGNISLKLTNVTEGDAGNYTCHVPDLQSQVRKGKVTLTVVTREESNKGNQTDKFEPKPESKGPRDNIIIITCCSILGIAVIALAAFFIHKLRGIPCTNGGQNRRRQQRTKASEGNNHEREGLNTETPV